MMRVIWLFVLLTPVCSIAQNRFDVVISEIMADPSPPVSLPGNEWIELKNTTTAAISLQNWRIGDAAGTSGPMPAYLLPPGGVVIVCTGSAATALSVYGPVITVTSFPSLDNDGDLLFLRAANGKTIHAINYTRDWYQNELKKEGGWTLEMIDPANPCAGSSNWQASTDPAGGTPGRRNSVDASNTDNMAPQLRRAYAADNLTIVLVFDEPVDSVSGAAAANYTIDGGLSINNLVTVPPLFNTVQLKLVTPMSMNVIYTITASGVSDCKGNLISSGSTVRVGLPQEAVTGECIINELLFNPRSNAYDYVEFLNNSQKIFDASKLYIASRNSSGVVSSVKQISAVPFYIFPGEYFVVTEEAASLAREYLVQQPGNVIEVSPLPSFPDEEGDVVALNAQGIVVDEVQYKDDWHFKLIENPEGISLERIDPFGLSQDAANWHSAASTAGYGTPTYKNSQYKRADPLQANVEITPKVFSPDNDGHDDIATIAFAVTEPGFVANVTIFDAAGRPVKHLVQNGTLGLKGYWNWDGLNDKGQKLPVGNYIVLTEIFNLQGRKKQFKNVTVLARKLQ
ncbi:MAG: lamin tail domain-containing protein [Chitinophagaceae bacterium]